MSGVSYVADHSLRSGACAYGSALEKNLAQVTEVHAFDAACRRSLHDRNESAPLTGGLNGPHGPLPPTTLLTSSKPPTRREDDKEGMLDMLLIRESCAEEGWLDDEKFGAEDKGPSEDYTFCGVDLKPVLPVALAVYLSASFAVVYVVVMACMGYCAFADPGQVRKTRNMKVGAMDIEEAPDQKLHAELEATILHAAAFSEFREHVRRLAAMGDPVSAYFLWVNAVEVGVVVPPGVQPDEAWRRDYENQEPMDLIMVNMYCGVTTAKDVVPQYLYELQLRISSGQTGQLGMGELFAAWRDWLCFEDRSFPAHFWDARVILGAPGGDPGQLWGRWVVKLIDHYVDGWTHRKSATMRWALDVPTAETYTSSVLPHARWGFALSASPSAGLVRTVESEGRCGWGPRAFHQQLLQHDCPAIDPAPGSQHFLALRTLAIVLGCCAMASSGKGIYAAQAASSSSGGDPGQGWSAADSLQQIAASRARQYRESEGLTLDNDFAFAFVDYDHVVGAAGHHVADEWLRVRSKVEEDLLHQGAQAVEGPKQPMPFKPVRKQILKKKPQTRPQAPAKATEADQRRVTGLVSLFQGMGSFKPAGILTEALKSEWKQTCTRIAQKKVKDAEKATLDRVEHVAGEFDLSNLQAPTTPRVTGPKGQAPVAEPSLIQALEQRIEELYQVGDERWSVLLGCWMMCFGCLRYTHITRSEPRKLTASFLHCRCLKGKQQKNRDGFDYAIPAHFLSGWFWAKAVIDAFRSLAPSRQRAAGLCFSDEGRPWTIKEVQESMQVEMGVLVDNPEDITTYSWRRVGPTIAQILECRPEEMSALGDWQERSQLPSSGQMALHYSSAKYATSLKVKALIWGATPELGDQLSWDSITPETAAEARKAGQIEVEKFLRQDRNPVWASTNTFHDVHRRIKLAQSFVKKAEEERQAAAAKASPQMPSSLNGKVLTATLKNGRALCPDFQTGKCANEPDACPFGLIYARPSSKAAERGGENTEPLSATPNVKRAKSSAQPKEASAAPSGKASTFKAASVKPAAKAVSAKPAAPGRPVSKAMPAPATAAASSRAAGDVLDRHLEFLGVGTGPNQTAQAPTCIWTSRKGGKLWLGVTDSCNSGQVPPPGLADLLLSSWTWPPRRHHPPRGSDDGAYLAVLLRALLAGESIDAANQYIEQRRNTQLHKVINDKGMKKWLHETFRSATVGSPFPVPEGYAATDTSSTHVVVEDGVTLCKHKQADGKAKRLVNPYVTQNVLEAVAWGRPWCDQCLRRRHTLHAGETRGAAAIETWIGKLGLGDKALLMTARVRRAWAAVGLYYRQVEQDRSKIQLSDLDTMLGETELRDTKQQFWRRYKLRFAPEVHPADTTISRVTREMQKRMLCVYGVWKVKSLQFQLTTSQKKRKVGDSLFVEEGEEEESCIHDYDNYLDKLYTLLLAYAMAGCAGVTGAPEPVQENNLGADTTKFVSVPLDVVFKYFFRAKRSSAALPSHARLSWLQARDLEERSEWVSKFRESTSTLGQVIQEVYTSRDAHWVPNTSAVAPKKSVEPAAGSTTSPTKPSSALSQMTLGKPINGKPVALTMKDGTKRCPQFQRGGCKAKPCPKRWAPLTPPRGGGGCPLWVQWSEAARGATSYGRPDGRAWGSPDPRLHQLWLELHNCDLHSGSAGLLYRACRYVLGEILSCGSVVRLWESGEWMETAYAACTLGGARCKQQLLRHNIEEIQQWPVAACHDPEEWTPYTREGRRIYPSKEEAEYTATLAYAIASWWAARLGLAQLAVPPAPFCATGRREHWLDLDPRAFREWAMAPTAAMLGLTDALQATRPGLPVRGALEAAMVSKDELKPGHLYVGRGSFQHRLSTTKCQPTFWWDFISMPRHLMPNLNSVAPLASGAELCTFSTVFTVCPKPCLFPGNRFKTFKFAMIEDLINSPPLCSYPAWLAANGEAWDGPLVPHMPSGVIRQTARIGEGLQVGAVTHRAALPPLLPFNLAPNEHFAQALQRAQQPLPHEDIPIADADLRFAADAYLPGTSSLRTWRQQAVGTLRKQRVIDNGDTGGQSDRSADANKLTLCSALRPAQHITLAMQTWDVDTIQTFQAGDAWESGQEDLPSAYRFCPMSRAESLGCVVVWYHAEWQEPAFQLYSGLLFGLPLAVTSFNRCSRLLESLARRFCKVLLSMYFDDASITDLKSACGSGQWATNELFAMVGSPFATEKKQPMQPTGAFLGLTHDFSPVASHNVVTFCMGQRPPT
eukprot:s1601_g11.t1